MEPHAKIKEWHPQHSKPRVPFAMVGGVTERKTCLVCSQVARRVYVGSNPTAAYAEEG